MKNQIRNTTLIVFLVLTVTFATACGPPETLTDTFTEDEFRQEEFLCQDHGLEIDFRPGKLVCSGELDGEQVVIEIIAEVVNGEGRLQILRFTKNGTNLPHEEFADTNTALAEDTWTPEEGYAITSIVITDNDLTVIRNLK